MAHGYFERDHYFYDSIFPHVSAMRNGRKVIVPVLLSIGLVAIMIGCIFYAIYASMTSTVMQRESPDGYFHAKLVRADGFDVLFRVKVNGKNVYTSPDFAPVKADFREHIAWDKSGKIVVLFVAGERMFGYQAVEKRSLTDRELLNVEFTPLKELRYEGSLPRENVHEAVTP